MKPLHCNMKNNYIATGKQDVRNKFDKNLQMYSLKEKTGRNINDSKNPLINKSKIYIETKYSEKSKMKLLEEFIAQVVSSHGA